MQHVVKFVLIGFAKSVVLFTEPNPTIAFVIPATVPVNVGESMGAFKARSDVFALVATVVEKTDVETFVSKASLVKVLMGFGGAQ